MLKRNTSFNTPLQQILLLEERVRRTGATLPQNADHSDRFNCIKCVIKGMQCLVDIRDVAEVIEEKNVTPIPGTVAWIEGVINYRGALVPVYNLCAFFSREDEEVHAANNIKIKGCPIMILRQPQEFFAIRIEQVVGMKKFPLDEFEQVEADHTDSLKIDFYADSSIGSEESRWWKFNVQRLLETIGNHNPMFQQNSNG